MIETMCDIVDDAVLPNIMKAEYGCVEVFMKLKYSEKVRSPILSFNVAVAVSFSRWPFANFIWIFCSTEFFKLFVWASFLFPSNSVLWLGADKNSGVKKSLFYHSLLKTEDGYSIYSLLFKISMREKAIYRSFMILYLRSICASCSIIAVRWINISSILLWAMVWILDKWLLVYRFVSSGNQRAEVLVFS